MNLTVKYLFLVFLTGIVSCSRPGNDKWIITDRIQYDVIIKSPDVTLDWWVQNIEGRDREIFINTLIEGAANGKIKAYDAFSFSLITPEAVSKIFHRTDTISLFQKYPPYEAYDSVVKKTLSMQEITRMRFLEEWLQNKKTLEIQKNVIGYCPMMQSFDQEGNLRGYMPLFWVFTRDGYPEILKK